MSTAPALTDRSVPHLPRGVRLRYDEARGQWLLMGPERLFKLDSIGVEILRRCDGDRDLSALVAELAETFGADPAMVERDVRTFLTEFVTRGMVKLE